MREIKFRAWNEVQEKMLNWSEFLNTNIRNTFIAPESTGLILMQYTGLKDKNGKEIYEGDIVELNEVGRKLFGSENVLARQHEVVGFKDGAFMTGRLEFYPFGFNTYLWIIRDYIEVIGNIYDNPELLKEE